MKLWRVATFVVAVIVYIGIKTGLMGDGSNNHSAEVRQMIADETSAIFGRSTVVLHQAVPYSGPTHIKPEKDTRVVALDIEFRDLGGELDLDDIDIVDGATGENFGSDPDMVALSTDGSKIGDLNSWPESLQHFRGLFIYPLPTSTKTVKLSYWGREILSTPVPITENGTLKVSPTADQVTGNRQFAERITTQ